MLIVIEFITLNMKPQSAKAKGRLLQKKVAAGILETFPSLTENDVRSTPMGSNGADVMLSEAAYKLFPYQIECKSKAQSQLHTYYEQAKTHGKHQPLVVVKKDRAETLAVVEWTHFLKLISENNKNKGVDLED